MSKKHWRSDTDRRKLKYSMKTSFKCHIGRPGIEPMLLQSENLKGRRRLLDLGMDRANVNTDSQWAWEYELYS